MYKGVYTYADTVCGCFTTLRKRAAFTAASSRLVAAAPPLGFFGHLPNKPDAARRFYPPPRAGGAVEEPTPWPDAGWRRGTISASSSSGQSSKLAPSPEPPALPPASPPPASVFSSMAAAPKSWSSRSCSARSGRNRRSASDPAAGRRRGFCQDVPTGQSRPKGTRRQN